MGKLCQPKTILLFTYKCSMSYSTKLFINSMANIYRLILLKA
jgi:hypothetical protein